MKQVKKLIISFIFLLLLVPQIVLALENPIEGRKPNLGPADPIGGNGGSQPRYIFRVRESEGYTYSQLRNHEAVCGDGNQPQGGAYKYNVEGECTDSSCVNLGKYWYAARKLAGCDNENLQCLSDKVGTSSAEGQYYWTIRSIARNEPCNNNKCDEAKTNLETEINSNGGKACKIYQANPYVYKNGHWEHSNNGQPMYLADCNVTIEENPCANIEGCCVDGSNHYIDGQLVEDLTTFLNSCKCTEHPEFHFYILEDGRLSDSESEYKYHCDCKVDNPSSPTQYYIVKDYKQQSVGQSEYIDHCKCQTFEAAESDPVIYFGPNPPETFATEQEQIDACKNTGNVCKIVNGEYYGKDGIVVTEEQFKKDCSCVKLQIDGQTVYYGPNPPNNILGSEEEWLAQCPNKCKKVGSHYYDIGSHLVQTEEEYIDSCKCRREEENGTTIYYGLNPEQIILYDQWKEECDSGEKHICEIVNGVYYGADGKVRPSKVEFDKSCACQQLEINGQMVYFGPNPPETVSSEENWHAACDRRCGQYSGTYYNFYGDPVSSEEGLLPECACRIDHFHGATFYYGTDPLHPVESEEIMNEQCNNPCANESGCCSDDSTGTLYYGGSEITLDEWEATCCNDKYDDCCVVNNKYYLDGHHVNQNECTKCKPFVSYHESCVNPEENTEDIPFSDGEVVGDLVKTSNEDKQSVNYLTYKEFEDDNIVKCVLKKKEDYAGNSLKDSNLVPESNNYCRVLCKEDFGKFDKDGNLKEEEYRYGYSVAGMQDANSGRYFRLSAAYNAKKTCYSNSAIDNNRNEIDLDQFNKDVNDSITKINNMINDMNVAYVKWKYLTEQKPNATVDTEEIDNNSLCTNAPSYIDVTITYPSSDPVQPKKLKIEVDKDNTTDYHISYKINEGNPISVSVQKVFDTTLGEVQSDGTYLDYDYNPLTHQYDIEVQRHVSCAVVETTAEENLKNVIQDLEDEYTSLEGLINAEFQNIASYVTMIKKCTSWTSDMTYNTEPSIGYKYGYQDENGNYDFDYYDKLPEDKKLMDRSEKQQVDNLDTEWETPSTDTTLKATKIDKDKLVNGNSEFYSDQRTNGTSDKEPCINDKYSDSRGNNCVTTDRQKETVNYAKLVDPGDYYTFESTSEELSNKTFTKKSIEVHYEYQSPNNYATLYPSGVVVLRDSASAEQDEIDNLVEFDGLPVQLQTSSGLHKFTFTFDDLGEYFGQPDEKGRVLKTNDHTDTSTVLGKYNSEERQIFSTDFEYEYLCYYRVNQNPCPTCVPECEDNECTTIVEECQGENCCPVCDQECVDCIYTKTEYHLDVPTIPLTPPNTTDPSGPTFDIINVVNPNGDDYVPYNWNEWSVSEEYGERYDIINDKAKLTIEEIETYGELIYVSEELGTNDVYDGTPSIEGISSPTDFGLLKVEMTPNLAAKIRNYNKEKKEFSNQTLRCYDYQYGTYTFEKIFCYSSFLDDYIAENPDNFTVNSKRLNSNERGSNNDQNGYWLTFISQPDCGGQSCGNYAANINDIKEGNMTQIGGPSWR